MNLNIEEQLINIIAVDLFSELNFIRDIEYPTELNAFIVVTEDGKIYKVSIAEDTDGREMPF